MTKKDRKLLAFFFSELFDVDILDKELIKSVDDSKLEEIKKLVEERYQATFGIVGSTGVGKTTTIHSLFGYKKPKNKTVKVKRHKKNLGKGIGEVTFLDFPGFGDWEKKKEFIEQQYDEYLPQCDVILWVLDASSRSVELDEKYLKKLPSELKTKVVIGLHKVNLVDPYDTWDTDFKIPSLEQEENIKKKIEEIARNLDFPKSRIIEYSAYVRYKKSKVVFDARYKLEALVKTLSKATTPRKGFMLGNAFLKEITYISTYKNTDSFDINKDKKELLALLEISK